jgi:hypothetical protein
MQTDDRETMIRLWSNQKHNLTVEEAETIEDQAKYDHNAMPMALRFKARVTLTKEARRRMAECPR